MNFVTIIFVLFSSATLPGMSADREIKALHRQAQRSVSVVPAYDAPARVKMAAPVVKTRRIVAPLTPVRQPVVEPPIPESDPGEFVDEVPVLPPAAGKQARLTEAEKAIGVAKTYYLRGFWEAAAEWYLKALDWDPSSYDAAEGFVMSAFHAGHYNYAYRMGEDISTTIPGVKQEVVRAANDEIELLLNNGRVTEAGELLNQFPLEEKAFQAARQKVEQLQFQHAGERKAVNQGTFQTQTDIEPKRGIVVGTEGSYDHERPGDLKVDNKQSIRW